jgi:hypothetical protein
VRRRLKWTTVVGWLLAIAMLAAIVYLLVSTGSSPVDAALRFHQAVLDKDAATAAKYTWLPEGSPPAEEQWRKLFARELKNVKFSVNPRPLLVLREGDTATVKLTFYIRPSKDLLPQERDVQVKLVRVGREWKVDVRRLARVVIPVTPL